MSAAYERVRKALEETPLSGDLDRLNAELHLTPDAAEWVIAALALIGTSALQEDLHAVERRLVRLPETLESGMRASGAEIVRGLGHEIAAATTESIKMTSLPMLQQAATIMADHVAGLVEDARKATQDSAASVSADIAAASSAMSQASAALAKGAAKVGGWTPQRIATAALGAILAAGMFAAGNVVHAADEVLQCPSRIEHVANRWHLNTRDRNALRNYVCKG